MRLKDADSSRNEFPTHYSGPSNVSDDILDQLRRMAEIRILIKENHAETVEQLNGDTSDQIAKALENLRNAFRYAADLFRSAEQEIKTIMNSRRSQPDIGTRDTPWGRCSVLCWV
jgi:hypothetical protein